MVYFEQYVVLLADTKDHVEKTSPHYCTSFQLCPRIDTAVVIKAFESLDLIFAAVTRILS